MNIMQNIQLQSILLSIIPILISLTLHEMAHGYTAYCLGDNTAKYNGRLTLNPFAHLDPIGTILLLFCGFGYAKPVPVDPSNFKNTKRDMAITALAGPLTNLLLAAISIFIYGLLENHTNQSNIINKMLIQMIFINTGLALFNMIPIPPLDGSKIILAFFPNNLYNKYVNGNTVTAIILMILLFTGIITAPLSTCSNWIITKLSWLEHIGILISNTI